MLAGAIKREFSTRRKYQFTALKVNDLLSRIPRGNLSVEAPEILNIMCFDEQNNSKKK